MMGQLPKWPQRGWVYIDGDDIITILLAIIAAVLLCSLLFL
jgi:hypothetical protein